MNKAGWRILADDLTGALDSAAAFAGAGDVPIGLGNSYPTSGSVQALSTGTRDVPKFAIPDTMASVVDWFIPTSPSDHFSFKKVDSLLRGNTFAEVAWWAKHGGFKGVVFAPALPAQGRFTRAGQHWVGPPRQPDGAALLPGLALADAFAAAGLSVQLATSFPLHLSETGGVIIPDVTTDSDLNQIATSSLAPNAWQWLWCGSAGLAWALARIWKLSPTKTYASGDATAAPLLVTASRHAVLRNQLRVLGTAGPRSVVLADLSSPQPLTPDEAHQSLTQQAQRLVTHQPPPRQLMVVGGDTLLALCYATGTQQVLASASSRDGWGRARLRGGTWDGCVCYSRSGAFGAPDDLVAMLDTFLEKEPTP